MTPPSPSSSSSVAVLPTPPPPFRFRPRRERVDWRRLSAVDVAEVERGVEVEVLQEHLGAVAFGSVDGERCGRCRAPVDPALLTLLRLAQLTVEWLLHCQELLAAAVRAGEDGLAAAARERDAITTRLKEAELANKTLTAELRQRKKMIRSQQSLLTPRILNSSKCPHCEKSFLNSSFLQNHVQRRHPDEFDLQLRSDGEKKSQMESLRCEISILKEQLLQQQHALQAKDAQEKEQQSLHNDLLRELERFRTEENARMDRKIKDSRDGLRREMETLYSRNIQAINEVNQNQQLRQDRAVGPAPARPERDVDRELQLQALQKLEQQMKKQDRKWESRLQEVKAQHQSEKNQLLDELSRVKTSVSEEQQRGRKFQQEMNRKLQEKEQTIRNQKEQQMRSVSSSPPVKVVEVPVVAVPAPEPRVKRVMMEEALCALKLESIQEQSEEDRDSSSASERRPAEKRADPPRQKEEKKKKKEEEEEEERKKRWRRDPDIRRETRPELEEDVLRRLRSLGVKPDQSGLKTKELAALLAKLRSGQDGAARAAPDFWRRRQELSGAVELKLGAQRRSSEPAGGRRSQSRGAGPVLQIRPRSSSLPSRATPPPSALKQPKTPEPAPRTRTRTRTSTSTSTSTRTGTRPGSSQMKTSTPVSRRVLHTRTPPFSSDEDSDDTNMEEDEEDEEEEPPKVQSGKSPQTPPTQNLRPIRAPNALRRKMEEEEEEEEEEEWSEVSELQEIDPRRLQSFRDQNGNLERKNPARENKVGELARKAEQHLTARVAKRPAGGVSVLPDRTDQVQELTYTDLEESSDWLASSLEEKQEVSKRASGAVRRSLESSSTSVWGTSTGKNQRSGLTDGGPGSTLKSSLCSLSDISDSEDFRPSRPLG